MTSADPRFMDTFDATWNTHNVPAIMEHFTNDAAAHLAPPPPPHYRRHTSARTRFAAS